MKKKDNKKINYFRIFLFILLFVSLGLYIKLYVMAEEVKSTSVDLPIEVTDNIWYEYGTLNSIEFSSGKFKYSDKESSLNSCNRYYYNDINKVISLNCKSYTLELVSISKYKLILKINNDSYIYYSSYDLTKYLMDNNINELSDSDIEEIMKDNDFLISKVNDSEVYKNIQVSKLSVLDELSIDGYLSLRDRKEKALVLLINPNMSMDAYDLIPIFISWKNIYTDYNFYYVNGRNLKVNDSYLLDNDKVLKDYLVGIYDSNILVFDNGDYQRVSVDIIKEDKDEVFNCNNKECLDYDLNIYDNEQRYENIEDIL
ncbi:MAG: hypothetical protein IJN90_05055 [Bacilli bacterium]|nr:hypothetical protein [Bacilli bacterium]